MKSSARYSTSRDARLVRLIKLAIDGLRKAGVEIGDPFVEKLPIGSFQHQYAPTNEICELPAGATSLAPGSGE